MAASAPLAAAPPPSSAAFSKLPYTVRFSFSPSTPQLPSPRLNLRRPLHPLSVAPAAPAISAAPNISVGEKLPDATLSYLNESGELHSLTVADLTRKKKVIIFAVPGAFAITCSQKHAPGFKEKAGELRAKGVEAIACVAVNDAFVMRAWKRDLKVGDDVMMLSDVNGEFTRALGVEFDLRDNLIGLGVRSRRYALLAEDGVVKVFNLEAGGGFTFSGADDMLKFL